MGGDESSFLLGEMFDISHITKDPKTKHFQKIASATKVGFDRMVFFDNESGNCREISSLGVTVGYAPGGVDRDLWQSVLDEFPAAAGEVVGVR